MFTSFSNKKQEHIVAHQTLLEKYLMCLTFGKCCQKIVKPCQKFDAVSQKSLRSLRGANECKSCRPRRMLKNAHLDAKVGFGRGENELSNYFLFIFFIFSIQVLVQSPPWARLSVGLSAPASARSSGRSSARGWAPTSAPASARASGLRTRLDNIEEY